MHYPKLFLKNIFKSINSSLSAPTKIEELRARSDEKTQCSPAGNQTQGLANSSRTDPAVSFSMVQTSKTDHFFKLAPFWSPLPDLIDFGMAGKLLTSATRWCSPFVDSVSRIWIKPKKSLIGCWAPTATTFGQSAPPRVQLTAGRNGHNRHFERMSLVSSVCRSLCTGKIELYVSWVAYFRGVLPWLQRTAVTPVGFACTGTISRVIVKVTSSSDLEKKSRTQQIYAKTSWQISTTGSSSNPQQTVLRALI